MKHLIALPLLSIMVATAIHVSSATAAATPANSAAAKSAHPDFTGTYRRKGFAKPVTDLSFMMPWVSAEVMRRRQAMSSGRPLPTGITQCMPAGPVAMWHDAHGMQLVQLPDELIILGETDHQVRHIYINGSHPANLLSSWGGHSIGRWEGDTLVVDTVGLNEKTEVDGAGGTPHSAALHVTERFKFQPDGKNIQITIVLDDPLAYKQPWTVSHELQPKEDPYVTEYACAENNKDGKQIEIPGS